jgi:hypothetical protein
MNAEIIRYKPITRESLGEVIDAPLWYHTRGLMQTATGYGSKLVTAYKVKHNGRLKRVYCSCFSNVGTFYIMYNREKLTIEFSE